ncbi:uncharacterized [Tachysurus ichikawai]
MSCLFQLDQTVTAVERLEEKKAQMNCSTQAGAPPPSRGKKAKKERATICDLVMVMPTGTELEQQQCVRSIGSFHSYSAGKSSVFSSDKERGDSLGDQGLFLPSYCLLRAGMRRVTEPICWREQAGRHQPTGNGITVFRKYSESSSSAQRLRQCEYRSSVLLSKTFLRRRREQCEANLHVNVLPFRCTLLIRSDYVSVV